MGLGDRALKAIMGDALFWAREVYEHCRPQSSQTTPQYSPKGKGKGGSSSYYTQPGYTFQNNTKGKSKAKGGKGKGKPRPSTPEQPRMDRSRWAPTCPLYPSDPSDDLTRVAPRSPR